MLARMEGILDYWSTSLSRGGYPGGRGEEGRRGEGGRGEGEACKRRKFKRDDIPHKRRKFLVAAKMRQKGTILLTKRHNTSKRRRGEACKRRKFLVAAKMRQKGTILLRGGEGKLVTEENFKRDDIPHKRRKFLVAAKMRQKGTILLRGGEEKRVWRGDVIEEERRRGNAIAEERRRGEVETDYKEKYKKNTLTIAYMKNYSYLCTLILWGYTFCPKNQHNNI